MSGSFDFISSAAEEWPPDLPGHCPLSRAVASATAASVTEPVTPAGSRPETTTVVVTVPAGAVWTRAVAGSRITRVRAVQARAVPQAILRLE